MYLPPLPSQFQPPSQARRLSEPRSREAACLLSEPDQSPETQERKSKGRQESTAFPGKRLAPWNPHSPERMGVNLSEWSWKDFPSFLSLTSSGKAEQVSWILSAHEAERQALTCRNQEWGAHCGSLLLKTWTLINTDVLNKERNMHICPLSQCQWIPFPCKHESSLKSETMNECHRNSTIWGHLLLGGWVLPKVICIVHLQGMYQWV